MDQIEYLIRHEAENTNVDFKAIQYKKSDHEALLKDIMSMANAVSKEDRYIIVGVNFKSAGEKDIVGIEKDKFIDSATYQQLVYENIEPEIQLNIDLIKLMVKQSVFFTLKIVLTGHT